MTTPTTIIPINIAPLDKEIAEAEAAVKSARERLSHLEAVVAQKQAIKKYILSLEENRASTNLARITGTAFPQTVEVEAISSNLGISDFIVSLLNGSSKTTKEIAEEYAIYRGVDFENARNNVSNALARLRDLGKIDRNFKEGERAADWYATP